MAETESTTFGISFHWKRWLLGLILFPILFFTAWTFLALTFNYSKGERAGYIQKFSSKGWIFKTWEGELAMVTIPGTLPEIFPFSVRDENVARQIEHSIGQRVSLQYNQHRGIPVSWFGDTQYFITAVQILGGAQAPPQAPPVK